MQSQQLKNIIESALLAAGAPLSIDQLKALFGDDSGPDKKEIRAVIAALQDDYSDRGIELREVASGFRIQVRDTMSHWLAKLWEERPPRYTRALMETLAIVAYRQPVTRGDIEEVRGVAVSTNIIRTLLERDWIKVVGHRDVPGKPAMFGTTREFLDYFGLKKLDDLPPLAELAELEPVSVQLDLGTADQAPAELAAADKGAEAETEIAAETDTEIETTGPVADADEDPVAEVGESADLPDVDADEDEDLEVSDEELAAALAVADAVAKVVAEDDVDAEGSEGVATDAVTDDESAANVASLDDARDAAAREPETDFNAERAEVVPLKQP